jgi:glycerophosphoryl diester phosphodiesterase
MRTIHIILIVLSVLELTWSQEATGLKKSPMFNTVNPKTPEGLQTLLKYTGDALPLVSAHRGGAAKGWPENCIATFEHTLQYTYAMIEVDPRYTKDGAIVLHHDATLERTTNGKGRLADFTLAELRTLRLRDSAGHLTEYSIPTLDEALQWARGRAILVLDQKSVPVEARVRKIEEHHAEAYVMLIVYSLKDAKRCHAMNDRIMMEVMITDQAKFEAFDKCGVPWSHVVAFVGHSPPSDPGLCDMIHAQGTCCLAGTSRNIDRQYIERHVVDMRSLSPAYHGLREKGVDLIETDIPREIGKLLYSGRPISSAKANFFTNH